MVLQSTRHGFVFVGSCVTDETNPLTKRYFTGSPGVPVERHLFLEFVEKDVQTWHYMGLYEFSVPTADQGGSCMTTREWKTLTPEVGESTSLYGQSSSLTPFV